MHESSLNRGQAIKRPANRQSMNYQEAFLAADDILNMRIPECRIEEVLSGLHKKGETYEEIAGFAAAMKKNAVAFEVNSNGLMDTCGTGGDGLETFNISTTVAFVLAAGGVKVVKHGNRSVSSKCGSADLLERIGIDLTLSSKDSAELLEQTNYCFLFAQQYHQKMKAIMPIRKKLGTASIFNVIGPLSNPAKVSYQMVGVYRRELLTPVCKALQKIGITKGAVIYGYGGMDELSLEGDNEVLMFDETGERKLIIDAKTYGLKPYANEAIKAGNSEMNYRIFQSILEGDFSPYRESILLNAGFAFYLHGEADSVKSGISLARTLLDTGKVRQSVSEVLEVQKRLTERIELNPKSYLDEIYAYKRSIYESTVDANSAPDVLMKIPDGLTRAAKRQSLKELLIKAKNSGKPAIIGEIKRGSPSKGLFAEAIDIEAMVGCYEQIEVVGISVLADERFFYAKSNDVSTVAKLTEKPILYKEFIVSDSQIQKAYLSGASVVLLIARMLSITELSHLIMTAHQYQMEVLMEIHDEVDYQKVLDLNFDILGINNRDLSTFKTDVGISKRLFQKCRLDRPVISESGIASLEEVKDLTSIGFSGVLMGEYLIKSQQKTLAKICGVMTEKQADDAVDSGADFVGIVMAESRRQVNVYEAKKMVERIAQRGVKSVGVFKDQSGAEIAEILKCVPFDFVQIHGEFEDYSDIEKETSIIRAFSIERVLETPEALKTPDQVKYHLIDSAVPGSGLAYEHGMLRRVHSEKPIIVAGGLTPENVGELIEMIMPFAVDVSSGVEVEKVKDKLRMDAFIMACKAADESNKKKVEGERR